MPVYKQTMQPYAPEQMFELVSDIKRYPEFIRWIKALRVQDPRQIDGVHHCTGEAIVAFKGFTHTFATDVIANQEEGAVSVSLAKGPLKRLENQWIFRAQDGGTQVSVTVEYEFSNFILQALARANHDYAVERVMTVFLDEASRRYGGKSTSKA